MNKSFPVLALFSLMSFFTNAGTVVQSELKVVKVFAGYQGGQVYFSVDKKSVNPKGCSKNNLVIDPSRSDVSQVLSLLLTAKATQSSIDIQVYDDYCFDGAAVIRRVAM